MINIDALLALQLVDDFSGAPIRDGGWRFELDGTPAMPLRKEDGIYVFLGKPRECTVMAEGTKYLAAQLSTQPSEVGKIHTLRLLRRADSFFPDSVRVEGTAPPGARVYAFVPVAPLELSSFEKDMLSLQGYSTRRLLNLGFALGVGKNRELFHIIEQVGTGVYRIDCSLEAKHKGGEPLLRAYAAQCDQSGRYTLSIDPSDAAKVTAVEFYEQEVKRWVCLSATAPP